MHPVYPTVVPDRKHRMSVYAGDAITRATGQRLSVEITGIMVFGEWHHSVRAAAVQWNAPYYDVVRRLRKVYQAVWALANTIEANPTPEAINRAFLPNHIIVKGNVFRTISLAAEYYGVPVSYVNYQLKKTSIAEHGQSGIDRIFDAEAYAKRKRARRFYAKGQWYPSMSQACTAHGVDQQTVIRKMGALDDPTQAQIDKLFDPPETHTRNPEPIRVKGVRYRSVTAACKALGMRQNTVDGRLKRIPARSKFWVDACFSRAPMPKAFDYADWKANITVKGQRFKTIAEACEAFGAHAPSVRRRLARLPDRVAQEQIDDCFKPQLDSSPSERNTSG